MRNGPAINWQLWTVQLINEDTLATHVLRSQSRTFKLQDAKTDVEESRYMQLSTLQRMRILLWREEEECDNDSSANTGLDV